MSWSGNSPSGHRCCLGSPFSFPSIRPQLRPGQPISYVLMTLNCWAEFLQECICLSAVCARSSAQSQGGSRVTPEAPPFHSMWGHASRSPAENTGHATLGGPWTGGAWLLWGVHSLGPRLGLVLLLSPLYSQDSMWPSTGKQRAMKCTCVAPSGQNLGGGSASASLTLRASVSPLVKGKLVGAHITHLWFP